MKISAERLRLFNAVQDALNAEGKAFAEHGEDSPQCEAAKLAVRDAIYKFEEQSTLEREGRAR